MRIVTGFSELYEVRELIARGADELYCGVLTDSRWSINHRPNTLACNVRDMAELAAATEIAHRSARKVYLALNQVAYALAELEVVTDAFHTAVGLGVDGVLVGDLAALQYFAQQGRQTKLVLSCQSPCFNRESVALHRALGASRITFPRHVLPSEIRQARAGVDVETEVFFNKVAPCQNVDAYCRIHPGRQQPCLRHRSARPLQGEAEAVAAAGRTLNEVLCFDPFAALYDCVHAGVDYVKLGNRDYPSAQKYEQTAFLAESLALLAHTELARSEFVTHAEQQWRKRFS